MKYLLCIVLLLSYFQTFGCSCEYPATEQLLNRMVEEADIVIEGTLISSINYIDEIRDDVNLKKEGYDVLFKVTKVIKGN